MRQIALLAALLAASFAFAQELHVNDGSTWREATEVHINDGGTWREIQEIYVNDGGTWRSVFGTILLDATLTVGDDGATTFGFFDGFFGSLVPATYTDRSATSQTINGATNNHSTNDLSIEIAGGAVNSDDTFRSIKIDGVEFLRGDASYLADSGLGNSRWSWVTAADPIPTSGTASFQVF